MIAGLILAGGASSRMGGGDKPLLALGAETVLGHVLHRLKPQVDHLALSANGDPSRFAAYELPVLADSFATLEGPLAGILAGLQWAEGQAADHLAIIAGDTPFFPADLIARFQAGASPDEIAMASSDERVHPVFSLWPIAMRAKLESFLLEGSNRSVMGFVRHQPHQIIEFEFHGLDPFFNINRPEDLETARNYLARKT